MISQMKCISQHHILFSAYTVMVMQYESCKTRTQQYYYIHTASSSTNVHNTNEITAEF